jgi:hypothetical protein
MARFAREAWDRASEDRVAHAARSTELSPELKEALLWRLVDATAAHLHRMRRWMLVGVVAGLCFELLNRKLVGEVTVSFAKLSAVGFLRPVMPVVVAAAFAAQMASYLEYRVASTVCDLYGDQAFESLRESALLEMFGPDLISYTGRSASSYAPDVASLSSKIAGGVQTWVVLVGPLLFTGYAFTQLFRSPGSALANWLALGMTLVALAVGWGYASGTLVFGAGRSGGVVNGPRGR